MAGLRGEEHKVASLTPVSARKLLQISFLVLLVSLSLHLAVSRGAAGSTYLNVTAGSENIVTGNDAGGSLSAMNTDDGTARQISEADTGFLVSSYTVEYTNDYSTSANENQVLRLNLYLNAWRTGDSEAISLYMRDFTGGAWTDTGYDLPGSDGSGTVVSICNDAGCDIQASPSDYIDSSGVVRTRYLDDSTGDGSQSTVNIDLQKVELRVNGPPQFSNVESTLPEVYSQDSFWVFNATWIDDEETNGYTNAYFESNFSGTATNYTPEKPAGTNFSSYNRSLPVGTYYWRLYAEDSRGKSNATAKKEFKIGKAPVEPRIKFNDSFNRGGYFLNETAGISITTNISGRSMSLWTNYSDGTINRVGSGQEPVNQVEEIDTQGIFSWIAGFPGNTNYSAKNFTGIMRVSEFFRSNETVKQVFKPQNADDQEGATSSESNSFDGDSYENETFSTVSSPSDDPSITWKNWENSGRKTYESLELSVTLESSGFLTGEWGAFYDTGGDAQCDSSDQVLKPMDSDNLAKQNLTATLPVDQNLNDLEVCIAGSSLVQGDIDVYDVRTVGRYENVPPESRSQSQSASDATTGSSIDLSAEFRDRSKLVSATLYTNLYNNSFAPYATESLTQENAFEQASFTFDETVVENRTVRWYISAADEVGNIRETAVKSFDYTWQPIGSGQQTAEQQNFVSRAESGSTEVSIYEADGGSSTRVDIKSNGSEFSFRSSGVDWSRTPQVTIRERRGELRDFSFLDIDDAATPDEGLIILPDLYDTVYKCSGTAANPSCDTEVPYFDPGTERPYYEIRNGKTYVYVNGFSGAAGAGADVVEETVDSETVGPGTVASNGPPATRTDDGTTKDIDETNEGGIFFPSFELQADEALNTSVPEKKVLELEILTNAFNQDTDEAFSQLVQNQSSGAFIDTGVNINDDSGTTFSTTICRSGCDITGDPTNFIADGTGDMATRFDDDSGDGTTSTFSIDYHAINVIADLTPPSLAFSDPTPSQNELVKQPWAFVNTSIADHTNTSAFLSVDRSLKGYWSMDHYDGTGVIDNSSYSTKATYQGTLGPSDFDNRTVYGSGIELDGSNSLDAGFSQQYNISDEITVEAWVRPTSDTATMPIIAKDQSFLLRKDSSTEGGDFSFSVHDGTGFDPRVSSGVSPTAGEWYHVVGVFDSDGGTNNLKIYVNGNLAAETTRSTDINTNSNSLQIGAWSGNNFNGAVDEVRIHDRALKPQEINASYRNRDYTLKANYTDLLAGEHSVRAYAIDGRGNSQVTGLRNFTLWGISPQLLEPPQNTIVPWFRNFTVNTTVDCEKNRCGTVEGVLRYNSSGTLPDTDVSSAEGSAPFYTHGNNPETCDLDAGESCFMTWTVNSTGQLRDRYALGVEFRNQRENDANEFVNLTGNNTVHIGKVLLMDVTFDTVDFGLLDPGEKDKAAQSNDADKYNISIHPNSNHIEKLWIKSETLTTDFGNYSIPAENMSWGFTNSVASQNQLSNNYSLMDTDVLSNQNRTTYYWMDVPYGIIHGTYTGKLTIKGNTTW